MRDVVAESWTVASVLILHALEEVLATPVISSSGGAASEQRSSVAARFHANLCYSPSRCILNETLSGPEKCLSGCRLDSSIVGSRLSLTNTNYRGPGKWTAIGILMPTSLWLLKDVSIKSWLYGIGVVISSYLLWEVQTIWWRMVLDPKEHNPIRPFLSAVRVEYSSAR